MKVFYEFESTGNDFEDNVLLPMYEKLRFEMMWTLRSLEKEIDNEGGQIIITYDKGVKTKGFTQELTDKIADTIKAAGFPSLLYPGRL